MGYESSAERWSPVQSVEKILLSVVSMLAGTVPERITVRHTCRGDLPCFLPSVLRAQRRERGKRRRIENVARGQRSVLQTGPEDRP